MYNEAKNPLEELENKLKACAPDPAYEHDPYVLASIEEALAAAKEGNFGVGAVIVDAGGEIVQKGHNHVFNPHFRSDIHAEMDAMSKFEDRFQNVKSMKRYTLFTSLEPCPMCLTRLITSGIGSVYHAAPDVETGMVHIMKNLTPLWVDLASAQEFALARCSRSLTELALEIFLVTAHKNTRKLLERR